MKIVLDIEEEDIERIVRALDASGLNPRSRRTGSNIRVLAISEIAQPECS
jgi:hypothetical protein